jgi:hypothetical protein
MEVDLMMTVTGCTCTTTCDQDLFSGRRHQHEDTPCPAHPEAPMPLQVPESVSDGLSPTARAELEWGLQNSAYKLQRDPRLAELVDQLRAEVALDTARERILTIRTGPEEAFSVPSAIDAREDQASSSGSSPARRRHDRPSALDRIRNDTTILLLLARDIMLDQRNA